MISKPVLTIALTTLVALNLAGCATRPDNLDLSLERPTVSGLFKVALEPPQTLPAINQIHSWTVKVSDASGEPVHNAIFAVGGGMPQHGHGLPTKPRITREIESGTYQLDGMKFSMPGWWEIKLDIQAPIGADTVTFNTVVETRHKA
jgi:hypothetical protein